MSTTSRLEQFDVLGKLSWLWMNSPLHKDWPLSASANFLIPAIHLKQFHIVERDEMPVSYCSWAWLSPEAEMVYMINPAALEPGDWRSGDRLWFVDWVAPFSRSDSWLLRDAMLSRFPTDVARAIRVKRDSRKARVMEFKGAQLDGAVARRRLNEYHRSFLQAVQQLSNAQPDAVKSGVGELVSTVRDRLNRS